MRGGHLVAMNIHELVLAENIDHTPVFGELQHFPPSIAMAVGKTAIAAGPEGVDHGDQVMDRFFGTDLYLAGMVLLPYPLYGQTCLN